jgi:hypothetical protein
MTCVDLPGPGEVADLPMQAVGQAEAVGPALHSVDGYPLRRGASS